MKKSISFFILFVTVFILSAQDYSKKVFQNFFDKDFETYEFNIRNPLFVNKFYVKDFKKLKNKIIKETLDSYNLDDKGRKSYSDSYVKDIICMYYFFNSDGRLTKKYYFNGNVNGNIFYKQKETYNCLQNSYEIMLQDFVYNDKKIITASIEKKDDGIILLFDKIYDNYSEIEFSKNKISKRKVFKNNRISVNDLLIDNNRIQEEQYSIYKGEKSYWGITYYENGCMMEQKRFVTSGDEFYKYELDNKGYGFFLHILRKGNLLKKV